MSASSSPSPAPLPARTSTGTGWADATTQLAALGGTPVVPPEQRSIAWPVITRDDQEAVLEALEGPLVSDSARPTPVARLEEAWAQRCGTASCVATSNGTTAIAVALAGLQIPPGSEVIVPALSFIATALAPLHQLAVPVFVDINPVTFCIDPERVAEAVTARTAAIVPVHLHGQPADMDALGEVARRHHLAVVEDAAQAHGARHRGRAVGGLGDAGAFSLQVTKNLPTCGEGGLVTTNSTALGARMRLVRQFGEVMDPDKPRDYTSLVFGGNHKMSAVQAAFTLSQLDRFDYYAEQRERNVTRFLDRLARLSGIVVPRPAAGTTHVWHVLRLRLDPAAAGMPARVSPAAFRRALHRLLRAEGVPVSRYQVRPLCDQPVITERIGFGDGYPWRLGGPAATAHVPVTRAVIDDSLTLQQRHLPPDAGPTLQRYAEAFEKVWQHLPVVAAMACSEDAQRRGSS